MRCQSRSTPITVNTNRLKKKAVRIAGIGQDNLVRLEMGDDLSMTSDALDAAIRADLAAGHRPAGIVLSVGGTSVGGRGTAVAVGGTGFLVCAVDGSIWAQQLAIGEKRSHAGVARLWARARRVIESSRMTTSIPSSTRRLARSMASSETWVCSSAGRSKVE